MKTSNGLWLAAPLLILTACEEEAPQAVSSETGGEAAGEILGGTISDDMIPFEELTSTSPPAERSQDPSDPSGPVTAGPGRPTPEAAPESQEAQTQEAQTQEAEPSGDDPASQ